MAHIDHTVDDGRPWIWLGWARTMTTRIVNTHEAKSRLSELIRDAEAGIAVIVARNGQPVARIVAWPGAQAVRKPGAWSGQMTYGDDIVGTDDEVVASFDESIGASTP